jgi:hypothetical protein
MPAGLAFREAKANSTFGDGNPFLLHTVTKNDTVGKYQFKETAGMKTIRDALYPPTSDPLAIYSKNNLAIEKVLEASQSAFYTKDATEPLADYPQLSYTEWPAYTGLTITKDTYAQNQTDSTIDWVLTEEDVTVLRSKKCCVE